MTTDAQRQMDNKLAEVWGKGSKAADEKLRVARPMSQPRVISPEREAAVERAISEVKERLFSDVDRDRDRDRDGTSK
ncbi:MAG: hypothetical protein WBW81_03875 [Methylocella sp.]